MILVTGGTGFIGKVLIRHLVAAGYSTRLIVRPSNKSPDIPRGVPVEVAISSLSDERSLRAAMVGVDTIYHLVGVEKRGAYGDLMAVDIRGTQVLLNAALDAGINRIFYLSHIGADRSSAYPVMKAKAIAEDYIRRSGIQYTILRTGVVYGPGDGFTTNLARLISAVPFVFFTPGDGKTMLQPLWVEDLATCLVWALDEDRTRNETFEIGGPEQLTFNEIVQLTLETLEIQRRIVQFRTPYLRGLTIFLEPAIPGLPVSIFWLDYMALNHICALDTIPRVFNLLPARMSHQIGYLKETNWGSNLFLSFFRRK